MAEDNGVPMSSTTDDPLEGLYEDNQKPEPARRFAIPGYDFFQIIKPPMEVLLEPWLFRQSISMVYARPGIGKSLFCAGIMHNLATGRGFLRWENPSGKCFNILYFEGEMVTNEMQQRLAGFMQADDRDDSELAELYQKHIGIFNEEALPNGRIINLWDSEDQHLVQEDCNWADIIIVDNLACLTASPHSENDPESWLPLQSWAIRLKQQGKAVIFVHHSNASGKSQSGTKARERVLTMNIRLEGEEHNDPDEPTLFKLHFEKKRAKPHKGFGDIEVEIKQTTKTILAPGDREVEIVVPEWSWRDLSAERKQEVIEMAAGGMSYRDIERETGISKSTVGRWVKKAKQEGELADKLSASSHSDDQILF